MSVQTVFAAADDNDDNKPRVQLSYYVRNNRFTE